MRTMRDKQLIPIALVWILIGVLSIVFMLDILHENSELRVAADGDVNDDGKVDDRDLFLIRKHLLGARDTNIPRGDWNRNGFLDEMDYEITVAVKEFWDDYEQR